MDSSWGACCRDRCNDRREIWYHLQKFKAAEAGYIRSVFREKVRWAFSSAISPFLFPPICYPARASWCIPWRSGQPGRHLPGRAKLDKSWTRACSVVNSPRIVIETIHRRALHFPKRQGITASPHGAGRNELLLLFATAATQCGNEPAGCPIRCEQGLSSATISVARESCFIGRWCGHGIAP